MDMLHNKYTLCIRDNNSLFVAGFKESEYDGLPEEKKSKLRDLLYILDRFSISFEGYHELTQVRHDMFYKFTLCNNTGRLVKTL
jgi:hypothetical protein